MNAAVGSLLALWWLGGSAVAQASEEAHLATEPALSEDVVLEPEPSVAVPIELELAPEDTAEAHLGSGPGDCETASSWASRHRARTRLARTDCTHLLPSENHRMRVSHLHRGLPGAELYYDRFGASPPPLSLAPVSESESKLELAGGYGLWSYETDFDVERAARLDAGRLLPEDSSRLQVKSGLDFGLLRSRLQLEGTQREEDRPWARGLVEDPGSTSELGGRAFVDVVLPNLPVLTLGAGRTQKEVFRGRERGENVESDVASAALWYGGQSWQAYAVSSTYRFRDEHHPNAPDGVYTDHYVSGSWWPTKHWTVNPSFQYSEASWDGRENWIRTTSGSLGLYGTGLWENGLLTLWGGYTESTDTLRTFDYQQIDVALGVEHTLGELPMLAGYELAVGGTAGVGQYLDHRYTGNSGLGYRTAVTFRLSGL